MTDEMHDQRYPLHWPEGRRRTSSPATSSFKRGRSFAEARDLLLHELHLLGARRVVFSSNIALRNDGLPRAGQAQPRDTGVAVYFELTISGAKRPHAMACDKWLHVEDNTYALAMHVGAMRGQERWGVATVEQSFAGFAQLPPARTAQRSWRDVLGVADLNLENRSKQDADEIIERHYRELVKKYHPDSGGDPVKMSELNVARDTARQDLQI